MSVLIHDAVYILFHQLTYHPNFIMYRINNDTGVGMNISDVVNEFGNIHIGQFHIHNVDVKKRLLHCVKQLLGFAESPDISYTIIHHKAAKSFQYNFMVIYDGHR